MALLWISAFWWNECLHSNCYNEYFLYFSYYIYIYIYMKTFLLQFSNWEFAKCNSAFEILQHMKDTRTVNDIWWSVFVCIRLISQCLSFSTLCLSLYFNIHKCSSLNKTSFAQVTLWYLNLFLFSSFQLVIILFNISILITCKRWKRKFLFRATLREYVRTSIQRQ